MKTQSLNRLEINKPNRETEIPNSTRLADNYLKIVNYISRIASLCIEKVY